MFSNVVLRKKLNPGTHGTTSMLRKTLPKINFRIKTTITHEYTHARAHLYLKNTKILLVFITVTRNADGAKHAAHESSFERVSPL